LPVVPAKAHPTRRVGDEVSKRQAISGLFVDIGPDSIASRATEAL
jgi:hypothetical protein